MNRRRLTREIVRVAYALFGRRILARPGAEPDGAPTGRGTWSSETVFESALASTEKLPERTAVAFNGVRVLYSPVLGMLYNVAQRLIDAKTRGREPNAPDEALILLCNRLFNESFAGYVVLSHGLLGAGQHHLRAAVETANLAALFLVKPEHAEPWLGGKRYSPVDVRKLVDASDDLREWYSQLSTLTHANYVASRTSVHALGDAGGEVLFYGGYGAPRAMASTAMAFIPVALAFLRLFYSSYSELLQGLSLLWPTVAATSGGEGTVTWDRFLDFHDAWAKQALDEVLALPEDDVGKPEWAEEILSRWTPPRLPPDPVVNARLAGVDAGIDQARQQLRHPDFARWIPSYRPSAWFASRVGAGAPTSATVRT